MRILVCGGRDFEDVQFVVDKLSEMFDNQFGDKVSCVIHGGAKGVDSHADSFAYSCKVPVEEYPANWNKHGKSAGYIRNKQMLEEGKPDLVIAFPGGKGTANMVKLAREAGVEVKEIK